MSNKIYHLLTLLILLCTVRSATASHVMGEDLTYKYVGTNASGQQIWNKHIDTRARQSDMVTLDIAQWPRGIYLMYVHTSNGRLSRRLGLR